MANLNFTIEGNSITFTLSGASGNVPSTVTSTTTTPYTASANEVILMNATAASKVVNLPSAATVGAGVRITVKKTDSSANLVTVTASGAETIDGSSTYVLSLQYEAVEIISDGTNWSII